MITEDNWHTEIEGPFIHDIINHVISDSHTFESPIRDRIGVFLLCLVNTEVEAGA